MEADWMRGAAGGLMIGGAAALLLLVNGRIMGASGILGGVVDGSAGREAAESLWLLAGLALVPAALALAAGGAQTHLSGNPVLVAVAGALVGLGTRLASGCTSGHGVCGISRLAPRGLAATAVFLASGAATMLILRHGLGML
jgi:uncharacterized membrane protein YedE/YeeE